MEQARKALERYQNATQEFEKVQKLAQVRGHALSTIYIPLMQIKVLKITLNDRKGRWKQFRRLISARARVQFFYLLSERGFRGDLLLNHNERKLDLRVRDTYRYDGPLALLSADANSLCYLGGT